jgi:hypothetical protein
MLKVLIYSIFLLAPIYAQAACEREVREFCDRGAIIGSPGHQGCIDDLSSQVIKGTAGEMYNNPMIAEEGRPYETRLHNCTEAAIHKQSKSADGGNKERSDAQAKLEQSKANRPTVELKKGKLADVNKLKDQPRREPPAIQPCPPHCAAR